MKKDNLNIIEKDLFNFIFHPDRLVSGKYEQINFNIELYTEEIEFLKKMKNQLKMQVSNSVIEKILSKINKLNCKSIISLEKVNTPTITLNNLVFSAESPSQNNGSISETYQDADSNFLVKLISHNNKKKIFTFCKNKPVSENLRLVIHPSEKSYLIKNTSEQIDLSPDENVEGLSIITS